MAETAERLERETTRVMDLVYFHVDLIQVPFSCEISLCISLQFTIKQRRVHSRVRARRQNGPDNAEQVGE